MSVKKNKYNKKKKTFKYSKILNAYKQPKTNQNLKQFENFTTASYD